jgi:hypothetical protein
LAVRGIKVGQRNEVRLGRQTCDEGFIPSFKKQRYIVSGKIGVKEIERLIQKLEIDKEILADDGMDDSIPDE